MEEIKKILGQVMEGADYEASKDFMEDGLIDSIDVMDIVMQLETFFDIEISGRDILPENFKNADAIEALVKKYMGEM